jgi:hypothetical protein
MVEGTPGKFCLISSMNCYLILLRSSSCHFYFLEGNPYGENGVEDIVKIEQSLIARRKAAVRLCYKEENVVSMSNFPLLGASQFGQYTGS